MHDATGDDHAPGDRVADRYLLLRLLEMGGMGSVWVAHHLGLDIHVAIKFIRAESYSAVAAERLMQEARAAARVDHPAIVHVSDVGQTAGGDTYLVMELLDGEALCDVLARETRLDPITTARVILPIAAALSTLHGKKIVHRDVKPENIFLACDDSGRWQPKLIDFGLARSPDRSARLTQRGFVVGTPVYMSAERMGGEDATDQDDVWSLAVVLYETLTGVLPFDESRVRGEARSLLDFGVGDDELWDIVQRGLARRAQRFASAQEFGKALAAWLWKRGGVDDITGVALRPTWLGEDDVRRLSSPRVSLVETARFAAPFRSTGIITRAELAHTVRAAAVDSAALSGAISVRAQLSQLQAQSSPPTSSAARAVPAPRSRSGLAVAPALAGLAVLLTATGVLVWMRSSSAADPTLGATTVGTDSAAPASTPALPTLPASTTSELPSPNPADSADAPSASSSVRPSPSVRATPGAMPGRTPGPMPSSMRNGRKKPSH